MIDPWKLYLAGMLISLILGSMITIFAIRYLTTLHSQKVKSPRDHHEESISRFGGLGMAWSFFITVILILWLPIDERTEGFRTLPQDRFFGFILGAIFAWLLGYLDDIWNLKAFWKLLGQVGLGVFAVLFGFEFNTLQTPFFQMINLDLWSIPITILWIVGIMNAMNLIDGLDGLASGISMVAIGVMASMLISQNNTSLLLLLFIIFGAVFSFWLFNRPPASIFMGDSGAYFLGYTMSLLTLWSTESMGNQSMLPVLILAIPIIDTLFAFFRRLIKGIPFYSADKDHIHHRLISKGISPDIAMMYLVGLSAVFGLLAVFAFYRSDLQGYAYIVGLALSWLILYVLEYDVIRMPFNSLQVHSDYRKQRLLMMALGKDMSNFLSKDPDLDSIYRSILYWGNLTGFSSIEIKFNQRVLWSYGSGNQMDRLFNFNDNSWEIRWTFPDSSIRLDSDVKGEAINEVTKVLIKRLKELDEE